MQHRYTRSTELFDRAQQVIPGGVNSPVRAFKSVGCDPVVVERAKGAYIWDVDGNRYIDYICSWGPMILGHANAVVLDAIRSAAEHGTSFGLLTEREIELAELLCQAVPCIEQVRLVNSGTEAVMSAIRLARAATGRDLVIKFEGGYHGHSDGLLAKGGSGLATYGISSSPGVPEDFAALTITIPFNDLEALASVLESEGERVACLVGEPVPANMGVVLPKESYWQQVRQMLENVGALLIFDEVITGFRLGWGGAQQMLGVTPDLCTLGKIIGGGLPVGAYGGRKDLMQLISPQGSVYQAGTLSGNPLAAAAGLATLKCLRDTDPYVALERKASFLAKCLREAAAESGIAVQINQIASMLTVFFNEKQVTDYQSAATSDTGAYSRFFKSCLDNNIMLAPSQFEAAFISTAHTQIEIDQTIDRATSYFREARS